MPPKKIPQAKNTKAKANTNATANNVNRRLNSLDEKLDSLQLQMNVINRNFLLLSDMNEKRREEKHSSVNVVKSAQTVPSNSGVIHPAATVLTLQNASTIPAPTIPAPAQAVQKTGGSFADAANPLYGIGYRRAYL